MQVSQIVRENLLIDSKTYHSLSPIMKDAITDVFSFYKEAKGNIVDVTGILELANGSTKIAEFYLEDGNTIILEKHPEEKITCGTSKAAAVGSPRS